MIRWFKKVFDRDKGVCGVCGLPVDISLRGTVDPHAPELAHVTPKSKDGVNHPYNYQIQHRACNQYRGVEELPEGYTMPVAKFLCVICSDPIPHSRLAHRGQVPKTCSKSCSDENKKRNQAARNERRKNRVSAMVPIDHAGQSP